MARNDEPAARVGVDVGGTFTDFVVLETGRLTVRKRLSTPHDPAVAVLNGLEGLGVGPQIPIAHGSTVATNALLERRGARVALITTRGFADVLEIGRQARPQLYDLRPTRPPALVPRSLRFEVDERMDRHGRPRRALSDEQVAAVVSQIVASGATAAAVCLLFSFANPAHEQAIGTALQRAGIDVSLSSDILPEFREFERTSTTVANAYLRPVVTAYLEQLTAALGSRLWVMQSDGTTVPPDRLAVRPVQAVLSGPAGGIVGALAVARAGGRAARQSGTDGGRGGAALAGRRNILTLDMGGTSTDVAFCPGTPVLETQHEIGGVVLNLPMLAIHTVGAGGGSIARRDVAGGLHVGPASAGASPGPACYGRGGTAPTVTDANLVLGRLHPNWRLGGEVRLDRAAARAAVLSLGDDTPRSDRDADAAGRHAGQRDHPGGQRAHGPRLARHLHRARLRPAPVRVSRLRWCRPLACSGARRGVGYPGGDRAALPGRLVGSGYRAGRGRAILFPHRDAHCRARRSRAVGSRYGPGKRLRRPRAPGEQRAAGNLGAGAPRTPAVTGLSLSRPVTRAISGSRPTTTSPGGSDTDKPTGGQARGRATGAPGGRAVVRPPAPPPVRVSPTGPGRRNRHDSTTRPPPPTEHGPTGGPDRP